MIEPVDDGWPAVSALSGLDLQQVELTSVPEHGPGQILVLHARVEGPAASSLKLVGLDSAQIVDGGTSVASGSTQASSQDRPGGTLAATVGCLLSPCGIRIVDASGAGADIADLSDRAILGRPIAVGGSTATIDGLTASDLTLRTRAANFWVRHLPDIQRLYQLVLAAGLLCYGAGFLHMIVARRLSPLILIATALGAGATSRMVLLALVDATSFPALTYDYMAPALPMIVAAAVLSLLHAARILPRRRIRSSGSASRR